MPPRKRKKQSEAVEATVASNSDASLVPPATSNTKEKTGACSNCRSRKIRCIFAPGATTCNKCATSEQQCEVQLSRTRSCSAPPSSSNPVNYKSTVHKPTSTQTNSTASSSSDSNPLIHTKRLRHSPLDDPVATGGLSIITEAEELMELDYAFVSDPPDVGPGELPELGEEIISALAPGYHNGGAVESSDGEQEGLRDETSEAFNLDSDVISGSESGSDHGETMWQKLRQKNAATKPTMKHAPAKRATAAPIKSGKAKAASDSDSSSQIYDPDSCVFKITCGVDRLSSTGSKSQVPFQIFSTISYEDLIETVADKLRHNEKYVKLQYGLKITGKIQGGFTSLQSDEEHTMFIETMRPLIVPPRLGNGKMSNKVMRPVIVTFEDIASDNSDEEIIAQASTGSKGKTGKKVVSASSSKQKPSKLRPDSEASTETSENSGKDIQQKHIEELQQRWTCEPHTKGSKTPTFCYSPPGSTACQSLSHQNIAYWALLIMKKEATVDVKPPAVVTMGVRQRTRNMVGPPVGSADFESQTAQPAIQGPPVTVQYQFMSPWPGPAGSLGLGQFQPPLPHQSLTPPLTSSSAVSDGSCVPSSPLNPTGRPTSGTALSLAVLEADIPEVIPWFISLEQRVKKAPCGVKFGDLGQVLDTKGFVQISQLSRDYISIQVLQDLLGIEIGTAILILQYVDADLQALHAHQ